MMRQHPNMSLYGTKNSRQSLSSCLIQLDLKIKNSFIPLDLIFDEVQMYSREQKQPRLSAKYIKIHN